MTTRATKPVHRLVSTPRGEMIGTIANEGIYVRRKGKRTKLGPVAWGVIEDIAAKMAAAGNTSIGGTISRRRARLRVGL